MKSPFKFLDPFEPEDKHVFFGRETETKELYNLVTKNRLTFVYGPSGTGKTSLVQCGLSSRFGGVDWLPLFVRRGEDINVALRREIEKALGGEPAPADDMPTAVNALFNRYLRPVYLIFDQFEELFILGKPAEQQVFYDTIAELLDAELPCRLLFILREDYFGHLSQFEKAVPELYHRKLRVEAMGRENLRTVITGSCRVFDIGFDDHRRSPELIVDYIMAEKTPVHMPYVQVYLHMLYQEATGSGSGVQFSDAVIRKVGPITDVLGRFLQEQKTLILKTLQQNPEFVKIPEDTVAQALDVFVSREGTRVPVRYTVRNDDTIALEPKAANPLSVILGKNGEIPGPVTAALISATVLELDKSRILRRSGNTYELAHDTLAALLDQQRSVEQRHRFDIQERIEAGWREHEDSGGTYFFDKNQLARIEPFLPKLALEPEQMRFLEKSRDEAERLEKAENERTERELRLVKDKLVVEERARKRQYHYTGLVAGVAMVAIIALGYALRQQNTLQEINKRVLQQQSDLRRATGRVVETMLREATALVYQLDYYQAWSKLGEACQFGEKKDSLGLALMEIAFFYCESNDWGKAKIAALEAAGMLENIDLQQEVDAMDSLDHDRRRKRLRAVLLRLDTAHYEELERRYFPEMIPVEGGAFAYGQNAVSSGSPTTVPRFMLSGSEITQWQFALFDASENRAHEKPSWGVNGDNPVTKVSWYDVVKYCNWLSENRGLAPVYTIDTTETDIKVSLNPGANGFRLPDEIEWEYVARGGPKQQNFMFAGSNDLNEVAWTLNNCKKTNEGPRTNKVKQKRPVSDDMEIYDLSGNVWEWCWNWYSTDSSAVKEVNASRVLRGGSWFNDHDSYFRVSHRLQFDPSKRYGYVGFRVATGL